MSNIPHGLPDGWLTTTLREIAEIVGGVTKDAKKSSGLGFREVPYLRVANVQRGRLDLTEMKLIAASESDIQKLNLQPGDMLLNEGGDRDKLGRGWIWQGQLPVCIHQNHVFRARLQSRDIDPLYIAHFTNSMAQSYFAEHGSQTTNLASISLTKLGSLPIWLPPSQEQQRIVAKLEELLSDLDAGVAELKAAQKKLAQYRQSLLKAAVEGAAFGKPYPKLTLGELVTSIGQGWSPKCDREPATEDEQWAVMKTTAIQPLVFNGSHNKALPDDLKPRAHLELLPGDLLVTRAGPRNRVGVTCLVRSTRPRLILCDKAYRIRCDEERVDAGFLELVLNAPHIVQRIDELKTGISDSGLNLTQDRFFTLEIPLPTIKEQRTIVERVNLQVSSIQEQEYSIELALQQSTAQRQNILRSAFSGQLVPQDPHDEPASALLERIRTERAARAPEAKARKPKPSLTRSPPC